MLGIVTGLQFEAALVPPGPGVRVLCHGMGPERATRAAEALVREGATALLSFGIAGGLQPGAGPGHMVVASGAVHPREGTAPCDPDWAARIGAALGAVMAIDGGPIACAADVVATPEDKMALGRATGANAVDMESHAVGVVAGRAAVPFGVIRAVADPFDQPMPPEVIAGFTWEGGIDPLAAARGLLRKPWLLGDAIRIGWHCQVAKNRLSQAVARLSASSFANPA